jgi:tRNA(Ile2) C34 agmatinyltransferase TiaS
MEHRIIQLNPKSPTKTTNCCATAVSFAVEEKDIAALVEYCYDYIKKGSYSDAAVMTVFKGLSVPKDLSDFGYSAKSVMYEKSKAIEVAENNGVQIINVTGDGGLVGAVAAIGCFDLGPEAAGVPEDFE